MTMTNEAYVRQPGVGYPVRITCTFPELEEDDV
jgi:hypothetical protein